MNRMEQAMRHLRNRLEENASETATEIRRGEVAGPVLYTNVPVVRTTWRRQRREAEGTPVSVSSAVWLISTERVREALKEGDFIRVGASWYRIQRDEIDQQVFQNHGEHDLLRAYNTIAWGV